MTESIEDTIKHGNEVMDAFLEREKKAQDKQSWNGREMMPDPIRELLDIYVQLTGQHPAKRNLLDWLQTGQEWLELGATQEDIRNAYEKSQPARNYNGFLVVRPGSLTMTIGMFAGKRRAEKEGGEKYVTGRYSDFINH